MHSSGSMTRKFGPSWKQSTGHTSTQSVYLHLMQFSVTTNGIAAFFQRSVFGFAVQKRRERSWIASHGAQEPECTRTYMRIPSTVRTQSTERSSFKTEDWCSLGD